MTAKHSCYKNPVKQQKRVQRREHGTGFPSLLTY